MARIAFAVAFAINFVIVASYRRKAQAGQRFSLAKEGPAIAVPLRLVGLAMMAYLIAYIVSPTAVAWSLVEVAPWLRGIGTSVAVLVVPPLVHWSQRSLGSNVTTTVITRDTHQLVTHGPYRLVRHPLYSCGMLLYGSLALIAGSWVLAAGAAVGFALALIRLPKEEAALLERFGEDYRRYRERTPRFIPRLIV